MSNSGRDYWAIWKQFVLQGVMQGVMQEDVLLSWTCDRERYSCDPDHGALYPGEPCSGKREVERAQGVSGPTSSH